MRLHYVYDTRRDEREDSSTELPKLHNVFGRTSPEMREYTQHPLIASENVGFFGISYTYRYNSMPLSRGSKPS